MQLSKRNYQNQSPQRKDGFKLTTASLHEEHNNVKWEKQRHNLKDKDLLHHNALESYYMKRKSYTESLLGLQSSPV